MNILISNFDILKNYTEFNAQYFLVLSKFASLGKEARVYLLKAKIVGRLLSYHFQNSSPHQEFFDDLSDVKFEENENPDFGFPIPLEKTNLSMWEQMLMSKRDTQVADAHQDYSYIFECLRYCLCSCVINTDAADTFVDDLRYKDLLNEELDLLVLDAGGITSLLDTCSGKISSKNLGSILLHINYNNREFDSVLRECLIKGIEDKQLDELKGYFPIFKRYLFINDDHFEERVIEGIKGYFGVLRSNIKFTSFMVKFTSYLLKLCNINRGVAEVLANQPDEWEWVIEWIKKTIFSSKSSSSFVKEVFNSVYNETNKVNLAHNPRNRPIRK